MALRYYNQDQIIAAARSSLRPRMLITMAATILGFVVIYGLFSMDIGTKGFGAILLRFIGGVGSLLWALFGLTALAHQVHCSVQGADIPNPIQAACFAWARAKSLMLLPAWGAGLLLALVVAEMLVLALANIPGLGLIWLALVSVPLLLLNTVVAIALVLALFNIAARVAISDADTNALKDVLWRLLRQRLPELLIYNLGGVLATCLVAVVVLSPLWLGAKITFGLVGYAAGDAMLAVQDAAGFWGGIAHLIGLIMLGALLAAIASVPGIVITHMTLSVQMELDASEQVEKKAARKPARKPARRRTSAAASASATTGRKKTGTTRKKTRRPATAGKAGKATEETADTPVAE
ncbi:MAG: hypothetical protein Q9M29_06290 [Mariprofundaceae bacterium]|nr:hypothetical protein [Mariprofundaceae bacterium]